MYTPIAQNGANLTRLRSDRQRRFVLEYLIDPTNATAAAIRAGYAPKGAESYACRLLKNKVIKAYLGKLQRQDAERLQLDRDATLLQLVCALTRKVRDFVDEKGIPLPPHKLPDHCQSIVDGFKAKVLSVETKDGVTEKFIEIEYKLTPHATAREQAMKHKGLFAPTQSESSHTFDLSVFVDELSKPAPRDDIEVRVVEEERKALTHKRETEDG